MKPASLSVRALGKSYGALKVSDDISLDIAPGEFHAIIGPNGAGKTSLIDQLSGRLAPDTGEIWFDDREITGLTMAQRARLGLARSFQITSILQRFTVLENVAVAVQARSGGSFRFWKRASAEQGLNADAMEALRAVRLHDRADRLARDLSHGETRQLELAIALATAPRLLVLDEPLAGAGREDSALLIELLQSLRGRQTIILVEHDMEAVFALAERVSVLVYGRILASGAPAEIRADPQVRAAYLGEEAV